MQQSDDLSENRATVQEELTRRLAKQGIGSGLYSFFGYVPQALLLTKTVSHHLLWTWVALVVVGELSNVTTCYFLNKSIDQPVRSKRLTLLLTCTLAYTGSVWGSVILLPGAMDNLTMWSLQLVAIGVIAVAATQTLTANPVCLASFTLGMLGPTILSGLLGDSVPFPFGLAAIGLFIVCQLDGLTARKLVIDSIMAEFAIRKAKDAAEAANRAKSAFLSNMSHELRTPLNAILGYTQLLSRQDNLTAQQQRQLGVMRGSGEHLLTLIGDILDLSKIEAQKMELSEATFSLDALLDQVIEIMQPRARQKRLALRIEKDPSLPAWVIGDERWVRQVLLNLLANAVKFTSEGNVTLRARYLSTPESAGTLHCEVEDTGIGIPADKLEVIFEPFTQLAPTALGHEGTGLGLSICRRMAALMGGTVTATSREGQGTTFHFSALLPATSSGELVMAPTTQKVAGYRGNRKRVLVVDDNPVNAALLFDVLAPLGFHVQTAANGKEAIELVRSSPPDLVLLDLVMPEMGGVDTAGELKRNPEFASIRIIGVSATITDGAEKQAFTEVCDAFLAKPVQLDELFQTIGKLLNLEWEAAYMAPSPQAEAKLTPAMLAVLVPELRERLAKAAMTLDGSEIAHVISHIAQDHAVLARALSDLIKRYDYQSILSALGEESA